MNPCWICVTAAVAVHVAEAADVHEDVEAEGGAGVEGAEGFVVVAAVAQAEFDDLRDSGAWKGGDYVADLTVGMMAGPVEQGGGEFDFERFGAFDEIDQLDAALWRRAWAGVRRQLVRVRRGSGSGTGWARRI